MKKTSSAWFRHADNAKDDKRIMYVIDQLGPEGYGIYWILWEVLRNEEDHTYPMDLLPILAKKYNSSGAKFTAIVSNYGLFEISEDGQFSSPQLIELMSIYESICETRRITGALGGLKKAEKQRKKAEKKLLLSDDITTCCSTLLPSAKQNVANRLDLNRIELNRKDLLTCQYWIEFFKKNEWTEESAVQFFEFNEGKKWIGKDGLPMTNLEDVALGWIKKKKAESVVTQPVVPAIKKATDTSEQDLVEFFIASRPEIPFEAMATLGSRFYRNWDMIGDWRVDAEKFIKEFAA
jgi:hypothetical protein